MGVWGAVEQEEAEVKYHSCLTVMFPLVPQAHGDPVIYEAALESTSEYSCPIAAHKHVYTRLMHNLKLSHASELLAPLSESAQLWTECFPAVK